MHVDAKGAAGAPAPEPPLAALTAAAPPSSDVEYEMAAPAGRASTPAPQGTPGKTVAPSVAASREMLDIEARVELHVQNARRAAKALHALAERAGGVVTAERIDGGSEHHAASMTLRVPSGAAQGLLGDLEKLGSVQQQSLTARDIGKEYFDAHLRLSSLETTLRRYEELLEKAGKVEELLRIEQELSRLRGEIEQVKGDLRWLSDRAARATLHVTLRERPLELAAAEEPEAKFFPGVRAPLLFDFGTRGVPSYGGGGVSMRFMRALSFDLDVLKRFDSEARGPDAFLASAGGEIYSNLLGGGRRGFLNPYLGWRAGYARFDHHDQALLGATLGVELYKNRWLELDLEARHLLTFGGERGAHYALLPALALGVAF